MQYKYIILYQLPDDADHDDGDDDNDNDDDDDYLKLQNYDSRDNIILAVDY